MSLYRTQKKTFKSIRDQSGNYNNQSDIIPLSLKKHIKPQLAKLLTTQWFQTAKEYFTNPPQIHIISIETKEVELLNIIGELRDYVENHIKTNYSQNNYPSTSALITDPTKEKDIRKIRSILDKISPRRITRTQRRALRKYIEINPTGREILKMFYSTISESNKIAPDMELIFNPYTSLINLAEIYAQCTEYSLVRYSVPELGIRDTQINLYYPASKRDEYLSNQDSETQTAWLPDAIRRVCFFNYLLKTQKQPRAIHIFLADFRKEFMQVSNKADLIFTPSEINTGVCDMTDIMITRAEESLKTIFHELIHFHSLDFKHPAHDELCAELFNITTEQSSFNLFEAHTECLASILHCITRAIKKPILITENLDLEFQKQFKQILTAQIYYTMKKAAQILARSGCQNYSEFINPTDRDKCELRENTNVFSYFFVKSFIYLGLEKWLLGCCSQRTARFIDTSDQQGGQETLKEIIEAGYKNRILQKIIDKEINLAQEEYIKPDSLIASKNKSLKMMNVV